jgi:hypothetical protein
MASADRKSGADSPVQADLLNTTTTQNKTVDPMLDPDCKPQAQPVGRTQPWRQTIQKIADMDEGTKDGDKDYFKDRTAFYSQTICA